MKKFLVAAILLLCAHVAICEGTQTWEQTRFEDFEKGTARGVAIRSDGMLELAPQFKLLDTTPSNYIWAIASDTDGNAYAAAGAPARIYRIAADGTFSIIFEPKELQVQALVEHEGALYAATSPDGKVYKLAPPTAAQRAGEKNPLWNATVYFEPHTKYIWALAMDKADTLYVATGDQGQIFRVGKDGQGSQFFQSDDANIRSLAIDNRDNLIAGSDGSGVIFRISPAGEAFALYSADKKEITALAVDANNNIYAAGVGEKHAANTAPAPVIAAPSTGAQASGGSAAPIPLFGAAPPPGANGGSEIYRIASDGSPTLLWSSHEDLVYALAFAPSGGREQLLAGTGNKGRVLAIGENGEFTDLLKASANQITGFAAAPNGGLFVSTSNLGKIFGLGAALETEGHYESDVFDAHIFSRWGRAEVRGRGNYELLARSGNVENPDKNWSPWTRVDLSSPQTATLTVPAARFVQWQAVLKAGQPQPEIQSVSLNFLSKNVSPVIDEVDVQVENPQGSSKQPAPGQANGQQQGGTTPQPQDAATQPKHNMVTVHWAAHDDNDDQLVYSIFYRGDGETRWIPLTHEKIVDTKYTFDAGLLPDGGYTVKVVASDAPSHSPGEALTGEGVSHHFEIDTTPPRVEQLHALTAPDGSLQVSFKAVDGFSAIHRAEYSLDGGDWQYVAPVGEISDSTTENYDFKIPTSAGDPPGKPAEHVVVVRAYDRFNNIGTAKIVVK